MKKAKEELNKTTNNKVYKVAKHTIVLNCTMCPPNKGCNSKNYKKHGKTSPKYKDKR